MFEGPVGVHLVGSVPLGGAEEVFRRVAAVLGDRLRRIPDGETGPRSDWIGWQYPVFSSQPQFEPGLARRLLLLPRAAAAAPALGRGGGRHGLRRARLRLGGDVVASASTRA